MKMFKIVSLLVLTVFAMSSMSLTFAAPITNNLQLTSNPTVTPDSIPDYVELTVKKVNYSRYLTVTTENFTILINTIRTILTVTTVTIMLTSLEQ